MTQAGKSDIVPAAEFIPRGLRAGTENRAVARDLVAVVKTGVEVFERGERGFVESQVEVHECPVAVGQRRKYLRDPAGADPHIRKIAEKAVHEFGRSIGLAGFEKRLHSSYAIGIAYRNQIMCSGRTGAGKAVDQIKVVAAETGLAAAPGVT